ncbi:MAG: glycosyltransferase [Flavobacteriia bacterium]|nr:glycosyltransferase [Flavobacteriia bacterium]
MTSYKHQWHVVEAVSVLRRETGWSLALDLVGPSFSPALRRLRRVMKSHDPAGQWVTYHGHLSYGQINRVYLDANLGVWASTCETFGLGLLEKMSSGLPIACSNRGAMPEILGDAGVYFNPENPMEIKAELRRLISDASLRDKLAKKSYCKALCYSWESCAEQTFALLSEVSKS